MWRHAERAVGVLLLWVALALPTTARADELTAFLDSFKPVSEHRAGALGKRHRVFLVHGSGGSLFKAVRWPAVMAEVQAAFDAANFEQTDVGGESPADDAALLRLATRESVDYVAHLDVTPDAGGVRIKMAMVGVREQRAWDYEAVIDQPGWLAVSKTPFIGLGGLVAALAAAFAALRLRDGKLEVKATFDRLLEDRLFVVRVSRDPLPSTIVQGTDAEVMAALEGVVAGGGQWLEGDGIQLALAPGAVKVYVFGGYRVGRTLCYRTALQKEVRIARGGRAHVEFDLVPREIPIEIFAPEGARVWVDDQEARAQVARQGRARILVKRGRHVVHAEHKGERASEAVEAVAAPVEVTLSIGGAAALGRAGLDVPVLAEPMQLDRPQSLLDLDALPARSQERPAPRAMTPAPPVRPAVVPSASPYADGIDGLDIGIGSAPNDATAAAAVAAGGARAPAPVAAAPAATVRYQPKKELGRGAMGVVMLARDTLLERDVAMKIISDELRGNDKMIELFFREARALAALNHPHIVQVYDFGQTPSVSGGTEYFIALELVEGRTLERELEARGALPAREAVDLVLPVCEALHYAHERRVIHRDIKPANIFLSARGPKVMDFGLARVMSESLIKKTQVSGTPLYMSPEQIKGENLDFRSDLYSLACTFFEMLTGRPPFNDEGVLYHHLNSDPPAPSQVAARVPPAFDAILLRCLAKDKDTRYASMAELRDALAAVRASV